MGAFAEMQAEYARHAVATFPVTVAADGSKRPAIRGWQRVGLKASGELARQFPESNALGFCTGRRSRLTVLDIDSTDERMLADALATYGETPVVARTASGTFHGYYRDAGEKRRVRFDDDKPIDLLGEGGFVVAPPSWGNGSRYELIAGRLEDLESLPTMKQRGSPATQKDSPASEGTRNKTLFRACLRAARDVDTFPALLAVAQAIGATYLPPMAPEEIERTAASAWRYEQDGMNWSGSSVVVTDHAEVDRLAASDPDAFALLAILRRHHWGRNSFAIAAAMAESLGWRLQRFRAARAKLVECGALRVLSAGGRGKNDPPRFAFMA